MRIYPRTGPIGGAIVASTLLMSVGCAHVNEERLSTEMDLLREEMRTADQEVEDRMDRRVVDLVAELDSRISSLEAELAQLEDEFGTTVERLESAVRFNTPIHFGFDEDTLGVDDRELLDRFSGVVAAYYEEALITVEGFTDAAGSEAYNQRLGQRRADAVRDYLASGGIPSDRMRTVSYGEGMNRQVVAGSIGPGSAGWQNRRVALVIDFTGSTELLTTERH